ncbi:MAG: site-2 protease family protein [Anaeroplasmataceae bacterium]|nr:site-2 protease family protein [Anaeroplasmataceae bacterium]MDE6414159.1 site-2 protease family protein [Anaeroplasmataceae bacterium]
MILALTGVPLVIVSIIAFIVILGIIIIIHEGGHFFFARRAGILCHEFSIGMGPAVYKKKFGETTFCIRAIPIGGYVSMAGEEVTSELVKIGQQIGLNIIDGKVSEIVTVEDSEAQVRGEVVDLDLYGKDGNPLFITINDGFQNQYYEVLEDAFYVLKKDSKLQITPYDRSFESKTLLQRFLTLFAGPLMNFILAIIIYLIVSFATGVPNYNSNVVGSVSTVNSSMLVEEDGKVTTKLQKGDKILEVNGTKVATWTDLSKELDKLLDTATTKVELKVERKNEATPITLNLDCYTYIVSLGISNMQVKNEDFPSGVTNGVRLGAIGIRYLDDGKKGDYPIQSGDILTKIRMQKVNTTETIEEDIVSWDQLIALFKDADIVNVQFEYYSYKKEGIVSLEDCAMLQTYGNDVLNNQRIDKIEVKIGFSPVMKFDFFRCIGNAFVDFWDDFTLIFRTIGLLIFPGSSGIRQVGVNDLSSFVGIFDLVKTFVGSGLLSLLAFMAMLSVNIGVMNLLPIPALDGGRIVFLGYELVTRKKPSKKVENIINNVFFILLMILFVYVTYNDIVRMIRKG